MGSEDRLKPTARRFRRETPPTACSQRAHLMPVVANVSPTTPASFQRAEPATSEDVQYGSANWHNKAATSIEVNAWTGALSFFRPRRDQGLDRFDLELKSGRVNYPKWRNQCGEIYQRNWNILSVLPSQFRLKTQRRCGSRLGSVLDTETSLTASLVAQEDREVCSAVFQDKLKSVPKDTDCCIKAGQHLC